MRFLIAAMVFLCADPSLAVDDFCELFIFGEEDVDVTLVGKVAEIWDRKSFELDDASTDDCGGFTVQLKGTLPETCTTGTTATVTGVTKDDGVGLLEIHNATATCD